MKTTITKSVLVITVLFFSRQFNAQNIGINGTGANAHASALLDVDAVGSLNRGVLIPRIPLTAINASAPVTSPATSLLVYNTATASTGTNAVSPGYYYWDGAKWVRFAYTPSGSSSEAWATLGNAGTNSFTNFLGTTDAQDLAFRRNNSHAGMITISNVSFGGGSLNLFSASSQNSAFGTNALGLNSSGSQNTALGFFALNSNLTGDGNTGVGDASLYNNTSGSSNTGLGMQSAFSNKTGSNNTAIGYGSMYTNTLAINVTAVGYNAGYNDGGGWNNTYLGARADATAGNFTNATAIGYNAKVGQNNALILGGTGVDAVKVGIGTTSPLATLHVEQGTAFFRNTATNLSGVEIRGGLDGGNSSSVYLKNSLGSLTTVLSDGTYDSYFQVGTLKNVGIGTASPTTKLEVTGNILSQTNVNQSAILSSDGAVELYRSNSSSVSPNTSGYVDLKSVSSDDFRNRIYYNNVNNSFGVITTTGGSPLTALERFTILNTTGNVGIGISSPTAKLHVESGSIKISNSCDNIYQTLQTTSLFDLVGTYCGWDVNAIYLGGYNINNGSGRVGDKIVCGGNGGGLPIYATAFNVTSTREKKKNINSLQYGLTEILKLNPVSYNYNFEKSGITHIGLIAEDVDVVIPEVVVKQNEQGTQVEKGGKPSAITYHELVPVLIKAIQEQQQQIESLKSSHQTDIEALLKRIEALEKK